MARPEFDLPSMPGPSSVPAPAGSPAASEANSVSEDAFADYLLDLRLRGKIASKDVCLLSWFAWKGGLSDSGAAARLAFRPGAPSGHYQRHLDSATQMSSKVEDAYIAQVPAFDAAHDGRFKLHMPFLPLHESLQSELEADESIASKWADSVSSSEWSRAYHSNRLVVDNPNEIVYPVAVYLDGVNFAERDGLLAVYGYNLLTQVRHMICSIRKSQVCNCSCSGWCSYFVIMNVCRWSIEALAAGAMPSRRHDGSEFQISDACRSSRSGEKILKACVVQIKGDWMEFWHTLGLPRWDSVLHPCFSCHCSKDRLQSLGDLSVTTSPFPRKTAAEYDAACSACEIWVEVSTIAALRGVAAGLFYGAAGKGRSLACDIEMPGLRLEGFERHILFSGDRLEPSSALEDVDDFCADGDIVLPCRILFWRAKGNTMALRRNPFFCIRLYQYRNSCYRCSTYSAFGCCQRLRGPRCVDTYHGRSMADRRR